MPLTTGDIGGCCCGPSRLCISACGKQPPGLLVELYDAAGALVARCTTDATGCCNLAVSGDFDVDVSAGGALLFSGPVTIAADAMTILPIDAQVICCAAYMVPMMLTGTDAAGSFPLIYQPGSAPPSWEGIHAVIALGCATDAGPTGQGCIIGPVTQGLVDVQYVVYCEGGMSPAFQVWAQWTSILDDTFTPRYLLSGSTGQDCGGQVDNAYGSANPSSAIPFAITFTGISGPTLLPNPAGGNSLSVSA